MSRQKKLKVPLSTPSDYLPGCNLWLDSYNTWLTKFWKTASKQSDDVKKIHVAISIFIYFFIFNHSYSATSLSLLLLYDTPTTMAYTFLMSATVVILLPMHVFRDVLSEIVCVSMDGQKSRCKHSCMQ